MKATLETVTGVTINRDIDTADSPMGIIRKFYEEDATAATQIFSNQKAILVARIRATMIPIGSKNAVQSALFHSYS